MRRASFPAAARAACTIAAFLGTRAVAAPAPSPAVAGAQAALDATPIDCGAVDRAFAALGVAGRQPGDVAVIVRARGTSTPCTGEAANRAAKALAIPDGEVVAWVLAHPEPIAVAAESVPASDEELGTPLTCGLLLIDRRLDASPPGGRLILTFRNKTSGEIRGHDIVLRVDGKPSRSLVLPKGDLPPEPLLGAAEALQWDTQSGSWQDRRQIETQGLSWPSKKAPKPLVGPVTPGGTFDIVVHVEPVTDATKASDFQVTFDSCVLR